MQGLVGMDSVNLLINLVYPAISLCASAHCQGTVGKILICMLFSTLGLLQYPKIVQFLSFILMNRECLKKMWSLQALNYSSFWEPSNICYTRSQTVSGSLLCGSLLERLESSNFPEDHFVLNRDVYLWDGCLCPITHIGLDLIPVLHQCNSNDFCWTTIQPSQHEKRASPLCLEHLNSITSLFRSFLCIAQEFYRRILFLLRVTRGGKSSEWNVYVAICQNCPK